jgi:hypothetical protein
MYHFAFSKITPFGFKTKKKVNKQLKNRRKWKESVTLPNLQKSRLFSKICFKKVRIERDFLV